MPVEIRELVIRAIVGNESATGDNERPSPADREELISECVEQVMALLEQQKER